MVLPQVPPGIRPRGLFYWGSTPNPGATRSHLAGPALLSLRGRLMAEEGPGSS